MVFDEPVSSVEEIIQALRRHGDRVRGVYRARYVFDDRSSDPYAGTTLERPESLMGNPANCVYPWEQIFMAAAACAGSDYPMLGAHFGIPLDRVELVVEGLFDPRGEFDGLCNYQAPSDAAPCYLSLHVRTRLVSRGDREMLENIHRRVISTNMVLGALRGIPRTSELCVTRPDRS